MIRFIKITMVVVAILLVCGVTTTDVQMACIWYVDFFCAGAVYSSVRSIEILTKLSENCVWFIEGLGLSLEKYNYSMAAVLTGSWAICLFLGTILIRKKWFEKTTGLFDGFEIIVYKDKTFVGVIRRTTVKMSLAYQLILAGPSLTAVVFGGEETAKGLMVITFSFGGMIIFMEAVFLHLFTKSVVSKEGDREEAAEIPAEPEQTTPKPPSHQPTSAYTHICNRCNGGFGNSLAPSSMAPSTLPNCSGCGANDWRLAE